MLFAINGKWKTDKVRDPYLPLSLSPSYLLRDIGEVGESGGIGFVFDILTRIISHQ